MIHSATSEPLLSLSQDATIPGSRAKFVGVCSVAAEPRPWLEGFARQIALDRVGLLHVGISEVRVPYRIVRRCQTTIFFLAVFAGEGRVFIDGSWKSVPSGHGCLLPPHMFHAFRAVGRAPWRFCWVCCPPDHLEVRSASPRLAPFDPEPLRHAIQGLLCECRDGGAVSHATAWVHLIDGYLKRFAQPESADPTFTALWERVNENLAEPWSLEKLAKAAHCGIELLRRRSQEAFHRSPMHQIIYLRMRRAAELLSTTQEKVETIATTVGYRNPFVFSSTFKKWIGCTPSAYRGWPGKCNRS
jgi:AraC-like DNA-binding protein